MFKLKNKEMLFGINKEASEHGTPVFEKQLGDGIQAEANRDGTIFVQKGLSQDKVNKAVEHEKVHLDQMAQGKLGYTSGHSNVEEGHSFTSQSIYKANNARRCSRITVGSRSISEN